MPERSKAFPGFIEFKAQAGQFEAVFSTFGVVDADGEVVTHEALAPWDGKAVPIVWGHEWRALDAQVGKGTIRVDPHQARIVGEFNMRTPQGMAAYETVKFNGELQQYSWGFSVTKTALHPLATDPAGPSIPHITGVIPFEVSPVLVGSNPVTGTLAIRSPGCPECDAHHALGHEPTHTAGAATTVTITQETTLTESGAEKSSALAVARAWVEYQTGRLQLERDCD